MADLWKQDAAMESMRTSRIAESLEMWRTVGIDPDVKQDLRVLDLASGCGIKSFVLAQRNPNVAITCADWAGVLEVAKRLADKWGHSQTSQLPSWGFDHNGLQSLFRASFLIIIIICRPSLKRGLLYDPSNI